MNPTAKDIAARCGVSRETVNQILRGRGDRYRPTTRDKVMAAATELGYRPNSAARAMRLGRFSSIGIVSAAEGGRGTLDPSLLLGIQDAACSDLHLAIGQVGDAAFADADGLPRIVGEWSCDGLLINYVASFPAGVAELLQRSRIPAIWLNVSHDADCIHPDDRGAALAATVRLIALGHRRIAWLSCTGGDHYSRRDRREGYVTAMREAGLAPLVHEQPMQGGGAPLGAFARSLLAGSARPTAVVCYSAGEAIPLAYAAAGLGLRLPADLSLVCLGPAGCEALGIAVTHARPDFYAMGWRAVDMIRRRIAQPGTVLPTQVHPWTWIDGATIAPPPAS